MKYAIISALLLVGCSEPELPECTDPMVKINKMEPTQYSWCKEEK